MASYFNGSDKRVKTISFIRIALAVLLFVVGIAQLIAINHWSSHMAIGLWTGLWIFVTGFFGYRSVHGNGSDNQNNASKCIIAISMAFSIVSSVFVLAGVAIFCIAMTEFRDCARCRLRHDDVNDRYYCSYRPRGMSGVGECRAALVLGTFTLVFLLAESLLSIMLAVLCCNAICCGARENRQIVFIPAGEGTVQTQGGLVTDQSGQVQQGQVSVVVPVTGGPPTMQVVQQVPQPYLAQQVQDNTAL